MNPEKLAKLQANANRSKGAPRRVVKKVHRAVAQDDRKLQAALEKLSLAPMPYVEQIIFSNDDGTVTQFFQPKVYSSATSNTYSIHGRGITKSLTDVVPDLINSNDPDSLAQLRRLVESYQKSAAGQAAAAKGEDDDDEVPDLVESFEDAAIEDKEEEKKEESA